MPVFRDPALGPVKKAGPEIRQMGESGQRFAFLIDGVVRFVGNEDQCRVRMDIALRLSDREDQDAAVVGIFR